MYAIFDTNNEEVFDRRVLTEDTKRDMMCFLKKRGIMHSIDANNPCTDLTSFKLCRVNLIDLDKTPVSVLSEESVSISSELIATITRQWVVTEDLQEAVDLAKAHVYAYKKGLEATYINFGYGFISTCLPHHLAAIHGIYTSAVHDLKTSYDLKVGTTFVTLTKTQTIEVSEAAMMRQQNLFSAEASLYASIDACVSVSEVSLELDSMVSTFNTFLG